MEKNTMTKLGDAYAEVQEATAKQRALAGIKAKPKGQVTLPKAPWDKKKEGVEEDASNDTSDDGAGLDKADPKAAKKKFKDRKDKDIDNDGDVDSSDEYLHKRRKAISKNVKEADDKTTPCPKCDGSMENHAKDCPNHPDAKGKDDTAVMNPKNDEKEKVATTEMAEPKWPVYKRIMEKVSADKAKKDAEKGEEMDSKDSEGAKKFVDDHEKNDEKKQGDKADIAVAIKKNAAAMANPMKAAPLRPGDNKAGDKVADKPEGKM
jgi:hypothetical protein